MFRKIELCAYLVNTDVGLFENFIDKCIKYVLIFGNISVYIISVTKILIGYVLDLSSFANQSVSCQLYEVYNKLKYQFQSFKTMIKKVRIIARNWSI